MAQPESGDYDSLYGMNARVHPVFSDGWISGMERDFCPEECGRGQVLLKLNLADLIFLSEQLKLQLF